MSTHYIYGQKRQLSLDGGYGAFLDPKTTAIVSIDMHEGHLSESPDCPCPAPRGREILEGINTFHRAARAMGIPVIHVRSELRASGRDDVDSSRPSNWRTTFPQYRGPIPGLDHHALAGTRWTGFCTEVKPEDEIVTGKKRLSAFYPTDLDFLLRQMGVTTVMLNGIMADCCVLNTAFDAANLGYKVVVAADLIRGTDENLEAAALSIMSLHLALVLDADQLTEQWQAALVP
jgi:nicotinamidase-related amidase